MTDAQKLKNFRDSKNLSQRQLAGILGIAYQTISMVENGHKKAPDSLKLAILRKYKIDFDEKHRITNYEKIKNMTVDEMIKFLVTHTDCRSLIRNLSEPCPLPKNICTPNECFKQWLLSEVE